jgi:uncharacterized protein YndB with AHSA1/START domain
MNPYGTIETLDDGRYVLRYDRRLRHPVDKVWAALTDPEQIEEWLARAEIELAEGGRARLEWLNGDAVAEGRITRLEPPHAIELDTEPHGRLLWELRTDGDGTRLTLTVTAEIPDDHLASARAGWHVHIDFLEDALDGRPVDWPNWPRDRWQAHFDRYEASMRPIS